MTTTKAQEISTLKSIAAGIAPGSYLADLFTPELIDWVADMIKADFPPDVINHLQCSQKQVTDLTNAIATERRMTGLAHDALKKSTEESGRLAGMVKNLEASNRRLERVAEERLEQIDAMREQIDAMKIKLYDLAVAAGRI